MAAAAMFAAKALTPEERCVDPQLGYPRGFAKLCRHAYAQPQGLITPFSLGPPQTFHPYAPHDDQISKLKVYDDVFPVVVHREEQRRAVDHLRRHFDALWQHLDHLENAGFDPAKFRLDAYGNVLYRDADPGSPLAWDIDYWFPLSRGGKAVLSNLRLVQWQACQRRRNKLEFLVPWWDLQLGVSANQFLSVFSSKNTEFRRRMFSVFFSEGASEQIGDMRAAEIHSGSRQLRECMNKVGFPASAITRLQKGSDTPSLRALNPNANSARPVHPQAGITGQRWSVEEEEEDGYRNGGLARPVPEKVKNQSRKGDSETCKENNGADKYMSAAAAIRAEQEWKQSLEEAKKQRIEEATALEAELRESKAQNLKEKSVLEQLEQALAKQKKRVEKQRKWSETQSQYRLCLEKMIRDTLHQCAVYKEQSRLNQAACNALLARLESQKSMCEAAELELTQKIQQREELEALVRPKLTKRFRHQGSADVGFCVMKPSRCSSSRSSSGGGVVVPERTRERDGRNEYRKQQEVLPWVQQRKIERTWQKHNEDSRSEEEEEEDEGHNSEEEEESHSSEEEEESHSSEEEEDEDDREESEHSKSVREYLQQEEDEGESACAVSGMKRKALEVSGDELDDVVLLGYEFGKQQQQPQKEESVGENGSSDDDDYDANEFSGQAKNKLSGNDAGSNNYDYSDDSSESSAAATAEGRGDYGSGSRDSISEEADADEDDRAGQIPVAAAQEDDEVVAMQSKVKEAMVEAILEEEDEEERVKKLGKLNLDKWLQNLLLESSAAIAGSAGINCMPAPSLPMKPSADSDNGRSKAQTVPVPHLQNSSTYVEAAHQEAPMLQTGVKDNKNNNNKQQMQMQEGRRLQKKQGTRSGFEARKGGGVAMVEAPPGRGGGIIGGLLKKLTVQVKNGSGASREEEGAGGEATLVAMDVRGGSRRLSMGDMVKRLTTTSTSTGGAGGAEERRQSPWRWRSPAAAFRRSSSVGCDAKRSSSSSSRVRMLSPWRRNLAGKETAHSAAAAAKAAEEERKVMESFSKLKLAAAAATATAGKDAVWRADQRGSGGGGGQQEPLTAMLEPRRSSVAILQRDKGSDGGDVAVAAASTRKNVIRAEVAAGKWVVVPRPSSPMEVAMSGSHIIGCRDGIVQTAGGGGVAWRKFSDNGSGGAFARKDSVMRMRGGGGSRSLASSTTGKKVVGRYDCPAAAPSLFRDAQRQHP